MNHSSLGVFVSTTQDGSMKALRAEDMAIVSHNQQRFLQKNKLNPATTTYVHLRYEGNDYCRYHTLSPTDIGDGFTRSSRLVIDALVTTNLGQALFLPLADCIGAVLYDSTTQTLMLSHLGRHNLEQFGGTKSVEYLASQHGVSPQHLTAWLSPAAGAGNYPLFAFNNKGLHDVAIEQLISAGVPINNITTSSVDTTTDANYFSHSEFLKGNRPTDGRFAVVAVMC